MFLEDRTSRVCRLTGPPCERKRKGIKDNAKDFGLSLWGMMLLFTQCGQGRNWSKFGKGAEFYFR